MPHFVCPYCEDITEQTLVIHMDENHKETSGINASSQINLCHQCEQLIAVENISCETIPVAGKMTSQSSMY